MIGSLSIRSEGQCSSAVQLYMHNRRRKGLPDYDHRSCILRGPISLGPDSKSLREKVAPSIEGEGGREGWGGGGSEKSYYRLGRNLSIRCSQIRSREVSGHREQQQQGRQAEEDGKAVNI